MRLLIADSVDPTPLEELRVLGVEVVSRPDLTKDSLPLALDGVGILVVRSTEVTAEAVAAGKHLNLIVRAGAVVDNIDVNAASARGIYVACCPGKNASAVAELTMAMILALDRRLVDATNDLRAGRWRRAEYAKAQGIVGRRIGIAGLGSIGREVLARARAFGMLPTGYSRGLSAAKATRMEIGYARNLEELARQSDVLTLHLPPTPSLRGVVGRNVLEALPDGAIVINTARSDLMDFDALIDIAPKKGLRLGLDVFANQPRVPEGAFSHPLLASGQIVATPHIGASTGQAQRAIAVEVARIVRSFLTEEDIPHVVNMCQRSPARFTLVLRMLDRVGALANTLAVLKRHAINIEEISNTIFVGNTATCTKLRVTGRPSEGCLQEIRAFQEVLHVDVISLPNLA